MNRSKIELWDLFQKRYTYYPEINLGLDLSRMHLEDEFLNKLSTPMQKAFIAMAELEKGGIANPDEKRMVGHYWLRAPELAPTQSIAKDIRDMIAQVKTFSSDVRQGKIGGANGPFKNLLVIGIGGSALGPQFVSRALGRSNDPIQVYFFDNTDPQGMDLVLGQLKEELGNTVTVVISKSGGTKETRNGMLEAKAAYEASGLNFSAHAVAVTGFDSELDRFARGHQWLARFPMWDWVGGRTSELSAVGLLPAALQGLDIEGLLAGARACDQVTRGIDFNRNPAALMAAAWFASGNGKGTKDLVILPYKDQLELFSKYLQQLIMESLGKEKDLNGNVVNQGLAVYGNKGSTDQHAYVQQLREGINNFFVTFIEVLKDREGASIEVEPGITSGDYLHGFYLGTRQALYENKRESITLTLKLVDSFHVGVLIALFERTVGLYANLINVNAYHQPGVEAGKKAAGQIIELEREIMAFLRQKKGEKHTVSSIANGINKPDEMEHVFKITEHLVANDLKNIRSQGRGFEEVQYWSE